MITAQDSAALVVAGALAGLVGTAGGITSLISYPALLAVGVPALPAAIANNVALVAYGPGAALASRPELRGRGRWLRGVAVVSVVGGAVGAGLLLTTPAGAFRRIVPFLVIAGVLALVLEPHLGTRRRQDHAQRHPFILVGLLFVLALYNGYFGAGSGVMTLTALLVLVDRRLVTANALKNVLVGAGVGAAAIVFALAGPVRWQAAGPLALGMLIGSSVGPRVTRRLPARWLRLIIALLGLVLAIELLINPSL